MLLEDSIAKSSKMVGSDAETALTRGEYLVDKAMQNLSDLGVYGTKGYMASLGIFDVEYISKSGPFKFNFRTKDGSTYNGMAKYDKILSSKEKTIVLSFENEIEECFGTGNCYKMFKIKFDPESTHRTYIQMGKRKFPKTWEKVQKNFNLMGLQEGYEFNVSIMPYGKKISRRKLNRRKLQVTHFTYDDDLLLQEAQKNVIDTQIKITKIGLKKPKPGPGENGDEEKFSKDKFIKVKGNINIDDESKAGVFIGATFSKIKNYLDSGMFYVKISSKNKNTIVLSDNPQYSVTNTYLTVTSTKNIDVSNPKSWSNLSIKIGKHAAGNEKISTDVDGTIGYLKIIY